MAATNGIITNHRGSTMSIYFASSGAVGTYCPLARDQIALSTDPVEFRASGNGMFSRLICGAAVTGTLQVTEDGIALPYMIDLAEHQNDLTVPGGANLNIPYRAGRVYRFKVIVALSA